MANAVILVNGLPASGKSTLAAKLALLLGCPMLSKDAVMESLAEFTAETVDGSALGGIAMDTVWSLAAAIEDGAVIDSFWFAGRDDEFVRAGIARSGATRVVEIWCQVPKEVAVQRFEARARHPVHGAQIDFQIGDLGGAQPIAIWPVVRVDTSAPTDFDRLLPELAGHLLA
jgi:predicted kinase